MGHLGKFTSTPYLVLFAILLVGISSAYAVVNITFDGSVVVIGDMDVTEEITGQTITDLDSRINTLEGNT